MTESDPKHPQSPARYPGSGTRDDPYVVDWDEHDPEDPYNWPFKKKWLITAQLALGTWTVSFASSAYSGGLTFMRKDIPMSETVAVLGISLYVLGFGFGPLLFASLSEVRSHCRSVFLYTFSIYTLFHLGGALGHNVATILVTRFFAGTFGSSPLTNAGGVIADMFTPRDRGVASALYATAPFLGPVIGPIVGGYISQSRLGWRFVFWLMFIFSALNFAFGALVTPETYAPVLLQRRARTLQTLPDCAQHYITIYDLTRPRKFTEVLRINLTRPFRFMFTEPIVTLIAFYISIAYATLYAQFSAFPIVFQEHRGFSAGETGLAFLGIGVGVVAGTCLAPLQNKWYWRAMDRSEYGQAPPEARLYLAMGGGVALPIGLFWFAWTTNPSIHYMVSIVAGIPIGGSIALIMQSLTAYVMDTYTIYFASAIASTVVLRSLFAAAFPLFSPSMFHALGDQWACSIFAFLAVGFMPVPVLFFKYGRWVRGRSKLAWKEPVSTSNSTICEAEKGTPVGK
ncbi:MFS general substrate transporter [Artomyces pyxidatus]|uniref:MFS general substrate transporter n=1 Tax=Artomyces pyxidatus TaxID=48021 RepID=A0ACB8SXJ7_9AGAM|nr:MFS general substrate transporter [Artomyces pyxidatus]